MSDLRSPKHPLDVYIERVDALIAIMLRNEQARELSPYWNTTDGPMTRQEYETMVTRQSNPQTRMSWQGPVAIDFYGNPIEPPA